MAKFRSIHSARSNNQKFTAQCPFACIPPTDFELNCFGNPIIINNMRIVVENTTLNWSKNWSFAVKHDANQNLCFLCFR